MTTGNLAGIARLKPFTMDPQLESLYVYAPSLIVKAIQEELQPDAKLDTIMASIPTKTDKYEVIDYLFKRVMDKVLVKFENDPKIIADCKIVGRTPECLKNKYTTKVFRAAENAFERWAAKHPERKFTNTVGVQTDSWFDNCVIL